MSEKAKEILVLITIFSVIGFTFLWLTVSMQNSGLKTGYKGGMHSANDGCGHVIGGE